MGVRWQLMVAGWLLLERFEAFQSWTCTMDEAEGPKAPSRSQFPAYDAQPPQVQSGGRKGRGSLDKETVDTETDMVNTVQKALNTTRKAEGRLSRLLKDRERAELQWREHAVAAREAFYRERDRHMRALKTFDASIQEAQQAQSEARQALRDQNRLEMQTTWKRTMRMASGSAC